MAAGQSLISELLSAINVPKLRAMPAYLSEGDSLTIDDFMQSSYAADYVLDTSNVYWGGEVNSSHIFDIYCDYRVHRDSVKTRLDMIKYVTAPVDMTGMDICFFVLTTCHLKHGLKKCPTGQITRMPCPCTH